MSFDFSNISSITIPEGNVTKIVRDSDGAVIWERKEALNSTAICGESICGNTIVGGIDNE